MSNVILSIQNLIAAAEAEQQARMVPRNEPLISITTRTSRVSFVYERMRNAVDYKEEHLLRRTAIARIIRRLIGAHAARPNIPETLVHELIHARYLPNNAIPQKKLGELEKIFNKYWLLLGIAPEQDIANPKTLAGWTLGIMASEIDEFLVPPYLMHAAINHMYEVMERQLHLEDIIGANERKKQIYLGSSRALYHNEDNLNYHLFLMYYPDWRGGAAVGLIREVTAALPALRRQIDSDLNHWIREKLNAVMRKQVVYFSILTEIIAANPQSAQEALEANSDFADKITAACEEHYREARRKLGRSIVRSVVYLLLTKFLLALILEIPVEWWLLSHLDPLPLLINLVFPPGLLAVIALSTKIPDSANTKIILRGILNIIHGRTDMIQISKTKPRRLWLSTVFVILYAALFGLSFGLLVYLLRALSFTAVSMLVFLLFLSLVSLFAYRIRVRNQELIVTPPKTGFIRSLWAFLTIPILQAGKWLSGKFAQINIFIFILDFVIEAPFKSFVKIMEDWMNFVQEKKEEI